MEIWTDMEKCFIFDCLTIYLTIKSQIIFGKITYRKWYPISDNLLPNLVKSNLSTQSGYIYQFAKSGRFAAPDCYHPNLVTQSVGIFHCLQFRAFPYCPESVESHNLLSQSGGQIVIVPIWWTNLSYRIWLVTNSLEIFVKWVELNIFNYNLLRNVHQIDLLHILVIMLPL